MTPDAQQEVWNMLDQALLRRLAEEGPAPVFATISGAHLYGFASPDSDVDLRGAFLLPARDLLGLRPSPETISIEDKSTIDLDWVAHDLRKFARLMTNHNGYVLEQLYSPLVVLSTPAHEALLELGKGCITRPTVRHYLGFLKGRRKRLSEPDATVKHLLYAFRVVLTGIHMMETGEVVSNLPMLNERFGEAAIDELIQRKREGAEKMKLLESEHGSFDMLLEHFEKRLHEAHNRSTLPEEPSTVEALEDFVVRVRLASVREAT